MVTEVDVEVWWAEPGQQRPEHLALLDEVERQRRAGYRYDGDRARFTVATALVKLVAADRLGFGADRVVIDRRCADCDRAHGPPRLPGHPLAVSISHSGDRVAVAVTEGTAVGVDVERIHPVEIADLARLVLAAGERAAGLAEFFRYWTRKEAVVKATRDGLRTPLARVEVSPPQAPARLLRYDDRTDLVVALADLAPMPGYAAAVAVLAAGPLQVRERSAAPLLAGERAT